MLASPVQLTSSNQVSSKGIPCQQQIALPKDAIVARQIDRIFRVGNECLTVLKTINFTVHQGDVQLLMGPSGSGKTTLLLILGGLLKPTAGEVWMLGHNITAMSEAQRSQFRLENLGFIFQDCNLFPALTAAENIEVALNLRGIRGRIAQKQARLLLEEVGIGDKANQRPCNLSGGQKQRVAIARSLAGNPQLIIADEPTAALDAKSGKAVVELLRKLAKESRRTVLMVTHDPRIIHIADRVTYLEDGILTMGSGSLKS